jgi:hypothetical protein
MIKKFNLKSKQSDSIIKLSDGILALLLFHAGGMCIAQKHMCQISGRSL